MSLAFVFVNSKSNPQKRVLTPEQVLPVVEAFQPPTGAHKCSSNKDFVTQIKTVIYGYSKDIWKEVYGVWKCAPEQTSNQQQLSHSPPPQKTIKLRAMGFVSSTYDPAVIGTFNNWKEQVCSNAMTSTRCRCTFLAYEIGTLEARIKTAELARIPDSDLRQWKTSTPIHSRTAHRQTATAPNRSKRP